VLLLLGPGRVLKMPSPSSLRELVDWWEMVNSPWCGMTHGFLISRDLSLSQKKVNLLSILWLCHNCLIIVGLVGDETKLLDLFDPDCVMSIKRILVLSNATNDNWSWTKSSNGDFSIKQPMELYVAILTPRLQIQYGSSYGNHIYT
jgi:hypothetical protein